MIVHCACCGRQTSKYGIANKHQCPGPYKALIRQDEVICYECAKDLDENGNFEEEVGERI
jgi:hypothetical protein